MRKITVSVVLVLALLSVVPATAATPPPGLRAFMKAHPGGRLHVYPMRMRWRVHVRGTSRDNKVTGNCGSAFIYDSSMSTAKHILEAFGLSLDYGILYGGASVPWWNESGGGHNIYGAVIGPSLSGDWSGHHTPTTGVGWIFSQFSASVTTVIGTVCHTNSADLPYSWAYAHS